MGESKIPLFAYVDESGNTGKNIFDVAQPDYFTAAMISRGDFDSACGPEVARLAARFGCSAIHANELGFGRLETVAGELLTLLRRANATFFLCRVEKKYLLATKMFDVLFDSGENAAVPWHVYNVKPLKIMMAMKLAEAIDDDIARRFWAFLLMTREDQARRELPAICTALRARLHHVPDVASRKILGDGLEWIVAHPECIQFGTEQKLAKQGHFPNLVAFSNLLHGLQARAAATKRRVAAIIHDEQSEFGRSLRNWHGLFSNAAPDVIEWVGDRYSLQWVPGSRFELRRDESSAGIQMADVALWLFRQQVTGKSLPSACEAFLDYVLEQGWHNDFSFSGVAGSLQEEWGGRLTDEPDQASLTRAADLLERAEQRRRESMSRYEEDGVPPFARASGGIGTELPARSA